MTKNFYDLLDEFEEYIAFCALKKIDENDGTISMSNDELIREAISDTLYDLDGELSYDRIEKIIEQEIE